MLVHAQAWTWSKSLKVISLSFGPKSSARRTVIGWSLLPWEKGNQTWCDLAHLVTP